MRNTITALFVLVVFFLLLPGAQRSATADGPLSQFFDDHKPNIGKIADDPSKFQEYVNSQPDVNVRYNNGETLLHYAASRGYSHTVVLLVKRGADINARDNDARGPLHDAMSYRRYDIARFLIEKGADTRARNKDGDTPLISIVYMDDKKLAAELVNFFIERGFNVQKDGDARLLNESIRRGHSNAARILLEKGIPFDDSSLYDAAMAGYEDIFNILLAKGAKATQRGILNAAAGSGNVGILMTLVQRGAVVAPDDIDFAVFKGNLEAAVYLNDQLKKTKGGGTDLKRRCGLEPADGSCKASFQKGYYDKRLKKCKTFVYGGCGGAVPFDSVDACKKTCE